MSNLDRSILNRMMNHAATLALADKTGPINEAFLLDCVSNIRSLIDEVERLQEVEADYTYVLNNLQWSNIGTGQGWIAKGIGGQTWTTAMQIQEKRRAAEKAKAEKANREPT